MHPAKNQIARAGMAKLYRQFFFSIRGIAEHAGIAGIHSGKSRQVYSIFSVDFPKTFFLPQTAPVPVEYLG